MGLVTGPAAFPMARNDEFEWNVEGVCGAGVEESASELLVDDIGDSKAKGDSRLTAGELSGMLDIVVHDAKSVHVLVVCVPFN